MRRVPQNRPLTTTSIEHEHAKELDEISLVLDAYPKILRWVENDIVAPGIDRETGRPGMTAEQALRSLFVKQMNGFSYTELAFHLADSRSYRRFCRIGAFDKAPKRSCLHKNIKQIRAETLEWIHQVVLAEARLSGVEKGRKARIDCTVVETNIHEPWDSDQLWDSVRVLARNIERCKVEFGIVRPNHRRVAKKTAYQLPHGHHHQGRAQDRVWSQDRRDRRGQRDHHRLCHPQGKPGGLDHGC